LHPGSQTVACPPRVREFEFTFVVDGQDGRLARGHSLSTAGITDEPFAWAISADNKLILGADTDGYFQMTVMSPDRIEMCYAHNGLSPIGSIVARTISTAPMGSPFRPYIRESRETPRLNAF
jgi:hypothetical protein